MIEQLQASVAACLSNYPQGSRVWLAYSGGVDSTLLLVLTAKVCAHLSLNLSAIHVHHGVAAQADEWVQHCRQQCLLLQIPLHVQYLTAPDQRHSADLSASPHIENNVLTSKISEEALRRGRYRAFLQLMAADEPLLLAHHQQDQVETVLLRLCRGTSLYGLQGMWPERQLSQDDQRTVLLLRPWLCFSRAHIVACAQQLKLSWIEDPSNQQLAWRRNFIRHQVLPLLALQWPAATQQIAQMAQSARQQQHALDWLLKPYLQQVLLTPTVLSLNQLVALPVDVQRLLLATWLRGVMGELVSQQWLNTLLSQQAGQYGDDQLYRFQQCLWWVDTQQFAVVQGRDGLQGDLTGLVVRERQGGERIARAENRPHQTLKNLFQQQQVPPWLRSSWPLIYQDDQLIAIPHLWVHADFLGSSVAEITWLHPGVQQWLEWRHADQVVCG